MKKSNFSIAFMADNIAAKNVLSSKSTMQIEDIELISDIAELRELVKASDDDDDIAMLKERIKTLQSEQKTSNVVPVGKAKTLPNGVVLGGLITKFTAQNKLTGTVRVPNTSGKYTFVALSAILVNGSYATSLITENGEQLSLGVRMPVAYDKISDKFLQGLSEAKIQQYYKERGDVNSYEFPIKPVELSLVAIDTKETELKNSKFNCTSPLTLLLA